MSENNMTTFLLLTSVLQSDNFTEPYPQAVNNSFIFEIIRELYDCYKFRNFVLFLSERLIVGSNPEFKFLDMFWHVFPVNLSIIVRSDRSPYDMRGFLSTPSLCLVLTTELDDPVMELAAESMRGVRKLETIFILYPILEKDDIFDSYKTYSLFWETIRSIVEWTWRRQFLNSIILTIKNNIFLQDPYPVLSVINATGNLNACTLFTDDISDYKGYLLDTPIRLDLPRVFEVRRSDRSEISGTSGLLFTSFLESLNVTLNDTTGVGRETQPVDLLRIFRLIEKKEVEISIHSYTSVGSGSTGQSYPIGINDWCIMVPFRDRTPEQQYLLNTLKNNTWILLCLATFYMATVIWICSPDPSTDFSTAFLQAICSLLCIVPNNVLRTPTARMRFLFFALFLFGFIVSNLFVSRMASYLTRSPHQQQVNSVDDLIASGTEVLISDFEYQMFADKPERFPQNFLKHLKIVSKSQLDSHRDSLNISYGYTVQTDRWKFLSRQQRHMKKPLFRLTNICLGTYYHVFPMQMDSHLKMPLKYFIMYASQAGFLEYWEKMAFADALRMEYVKMFMSHTNVLPLSMTFFMHIWFVWWIGLISAGVAFLFEMKWTRLVKQIKRFRKTSLRIKK